MSSWKVSTAISTMCGLTSLRILRGGGGGGTGPSGKGDGRLLTTEVKLSVLEVMLEVMLEVDVAAVEVVEVVVAELEVDEDVAEEGDAPEE